MKIQFITIIFLTYFSYVFGQENYVEYHKQAREIENRIIDSSYSKAVEMYHSLFEKYDFVFAEDCFRAAQTAVIDNDSTSALTFLERATKQGVKKEKIMIDSVLNGLEKSKFWTEYEQNYDSLRNIYLESINWELRSKINKLYDLDQLYRDKHELHPWNFLWRPLIGVKWKKVVTQIVENELTPLILKYGFPNEKLIGVDEAAFHHKHQYDKLKSNFAFIILVHYYSHPRPTSLNDILLSNIETGNISPNQYGSLIDFQAQWGRNKYYKGLHYNEWHSAKDEKDNEQISKNRVAIGLESFETRKIKFQRGLDACKERKKGNYKHVRFWIYCG